VKSSGKTLPSLTRQNFLKPHSANHTLMRKTLFAAVALAPLWLLASQTPAAAQKTISSSISTPQTTAADGDITINSGGTIQPTTTGTAAVTVNSSNNVTNSGSITFNNLNSVVGIAVQGGNGSAATPLLISNVGSITVSESFTASDANSDGVTEAPYASTTSLNRYGIQLTGTSAFTGSIINSGVITVKGDSSYGISLEAPLTGSLTNSGTITLTGDNSVALQETAGVSGNILVSGAISATGSGTTKAVNLSGNVGGSVDIYSAITSTGYGLTTRPTASSTLTTIQATPTEVQQSGGGVVVGANVGTGVFIASAPANTNTSDVTTDRDGDGVIDSGEAAGSITNFGKAAALTIGSATQGVTLGGFTAVGAYATGNPNNGYGLIVEGTVSGQGLYDGVTSNAIQIGGVDNVTTVNGVTTTTAGGATDLTNGLRNTGSITSQSYAASSTAILIGSGATVRTIDNDGAISASILAPNTTTSTFPAYGSTTAPVVATAIQTTAGSTVGSLINTGTISANITGDKNDVVSAVAVQDLGGKLSNISNTGTISATFTADALGATVNGQPITLANGTKSLNGNVALDLSANTSGVTLSQTQAPDVVVTTTTTNSVPVVTVSTGATAVGVLPTTAITSTTVTNGNTTTVTTTTAAPAIFGDVYLGSGDNSVDLEAGTETGALGLGSGATALLTINNGAVYSGALTYTGAALTVNVVNGVLDNRSASTYSTANLTVGAKGTLYFAVDPVNNAASTFNVQAGGTATFAEGAKLGLTFISNATQAETFNVVNAPGGLSIGESATSLVGAVPYMFNASFTPNVTAGTIQLTIAPKTAQQLGLSSNVAGGLAPVYQALTLDTDVQAVFLNQYTKAGFVAAYNQILPDYAGGAFQAANAASLAISRATAEANDIENPAGSRGAWAQEITFGVNQGAGKTDGFQGGGFGFVGGVETGGSGLGAFGLTAAFINSSTANQHLPGDNQTALTELELGTYWQGDFNGLVADARVGAGYTWMAGRREFVETDSTTGDITLDRKNKSDWNGYTLSGHFGLAYDWKLPSRFLGGGWFLKPQVHADYFRMNESAYNENEAQGGAALSLAIGSRTGQEESGTASLVIGRQIGTGVVWRPQLELGVRDVFGGDAGDTTARFLMVPNAATFTLNPADIQGAAGIARFKLKASSEYYEIGVEAGGEVLSSRYEEGDVKASIRVLF